MSDHNCDLPTIFIRANDKTGKFELWLLSEDRKKYDLLDSYKTKQAAEKVMEARVFASVVTNSVLSRIR
jgi:hypothetical protein